jgi:hypothetical protein
MRCPHNPTVYTLVEYDGRHWCHHCRSYHPAPERTLQPPEPRHGSKSTDSGTSLSPTESESDKRTEGTVENLQHPQVFLLLPPQASNVLAWKSKTLLHRPRLPVVCL